MVKILTDSSCDLSPARCEELGVEMLPITVNFGGESFRAHEDISNEEFYEKLAAASELPKTAQITPAFFEEKFTGYKESGEEVVCLFISSMMSGTLQSARIAKNMVNADKVYLPDTLNVTFALGLLVEEAVKMRDRGLSAAEIASEVEKLVPRVRLWALIDDLKYLKMGGRLSATSALVASILGICPIITLENGLVEVVGKARGKKAAFKFIQNMVAKEPISGDFAVTIGHAAVPNTRDDFMDFMSAELKKREILKLDIGSIVGTHTGPGACGLAYIRK
ncbi:MULTISPECIES: DegV family protein [unclassified Acutalibacter]|jgi:DegV family protein with EDD domain|uniref:DegV family protein n=1 Tax=unclassified Acutalibacter TaxID=2620728 RepID=UPI001411CFD7|nr:MULTISPECIES: DegV family protein [unclassified Acutalibacter]MCI9225798.1 DegV family protein [Acutalibacter sp.]NBJ90572.1 DegV family protein [Acutalibacter sp. 1XD8-36]